MEQPTMLKRPSCVGGGGKGAVSRYGSRGNTVTESLHDIFHCEQFLTEEIST